MALALRPHGVGATELTRIVAGAPTTVQSSLHLLERHGLVNRHGTRIFLAWAHHAAPEAVALGLRLPEPDAALRLVLRASDAIDFAVVDDLGFVVATRSDADPESRAQIEAALDTIRRDRTDVRPVLRFEIHELTRILHSAMGLRRRIATAEIIKGSVRAAGPSDGPG